MTADYRRLATDGLWRNNIVLTQGLALCPLLAVTGTATNGLGLGLASTFVLTVSGALVSLFRGIITPEVRLPIFILLIAVLVTLVDRVMHAWLYDLYQVLGLFIPLIVTNCAILGRAESFAARNPLAPAAMDGLMMGLGFTAVFVVLGGLREIVGQGTLFADADRLLGDGLGFLEVHLVPGDRGLLLALLPPGGFIALGFLWVGKRWLERRPTAERDAAPETAGS
jgi:electron transport complex protein RnfE